MLATDHGRNTPAETNFCWHLEQEDPLYAVCIDRYYRPLSSYRHASNAGIPVCGADQGINTCTVVFGVNTHSVPTVDQFLRVEWTAAFPLCTKHCVAYIDLYNVYRILLWDNYVI